MISIDFMTEADINGVFEVECECFLNGWSKKSFEDELKNKHTIYLTAKYGERVIGYIGAWCVAGDADITNIAVIKEFRRQGIAKRLLENLILKLKEKGALNVRLEVRCSNDGAIALYNGFGFLKIYIREKYYDNKEDAIIMEKILQEDKIRETDTRN